MKNKQFDVIFLCQFFYPEYISSAVLPYETATALSNSRLKVGALCGFPKEYSLSHEVKKIEVSNGIYIKRIKYVQLKRVKLIGRLINYFSFTFAAFLNIGFLSQAKIVIVYSNPPIIPIIALISKVLFRTKIIFVSYDQYPEIAIKTSVLKSTSIVVKLMNKINHLFYPRIDYLIALSNDMKQFIIANRNIKADKIKVIPNWADDVNNISQSKTKEQEIEKIFKQYSFVVSYLGNMGIAQEFETLLNSILELKDVKGIGFIFAGHGSRVDEIKHFVDINELTNVHFLGFLHNDDYHYVLANSGAFVVSLDEDLLGLASPSKVYNYYMAGKPILAIMPEESDVVKEVLESKCGYWVKAGNHNDLSNSIISLDENRELLQSMSNNARMLYENNFTQLLSTNKYLEIVNEVLKYAT